MYDIVCRLNLAAGIGMRLFVPGGNNVTCNSPLVKLFSVLLTFSICVLWVAFVRNQASCENHPSNTSLLVD
jgi:hypothetical protein